MSRRTDRRSEHREVAYRPAREKPRRKGSMRLYMDFARRYLKPSMGTLLLCLLLFSLNACSVYLMAYYASILVDDILVVSAQPVVAAHSLRREGGAAGVGRQAAERRLPAHGRVSDEKREAEDTGRPVGAMGRLFGLFVVYVCTLFGLNIALRLAEGLRIRLSQQLTGRLREDLHGKILSLSSSYHRAHPPGRLMARILSDVNVVQMQMLRTVLETGSQVVMFIVGVVILLVLDWRIAVLAVIAMVPYVLLIRRVRGELRHVNTEARHTNACLWGLSSQKLDAIQAIRAYGREKHEALSFHRLGACLLRDTLRQQRLSAGLSRSTQILTGVTTTAIFLICAHAVITGNMTLGKMMYAYGASANLFTPVLMLAQMSVVITNLLVILQRLNEVFEEPVEVKESPDAVALPERLRYGISLNRVTFAYGEHADPVLRDVSFTVPAGAWVCIVGPSGAGKTTVLQLLARLYDPSSGEILADGTPLAGVRFVSLRQRIALVPQEPQIFGGTVRDNICYGRPEAEPNQIMAAARAAECHDFIMDLQVQYETVVGEKGLTLSGGQRQRISLARALLPEPSVLLLDDCTSALDADTERRIQGTLSRVMQHKTAVIVSHRVSMAMRCHKVVVLEEGTVTAVGTHDELLATSEFYAQLHAEQTK